MGFQLDNITTPQELPIKEKSEISGMLQKEIRISGKILSNKRKENFYTELSILLKAGIHLKEALLLICENEKKKSVKLFFSDITNEIISGKTFSETMKPKKDITTYEYYSLYIGEETGTLNEVTESLGYFFASKNEQRRILIGALMYPIVIFITAILVVVFMLKFVVPMFQDIFKQHEVSLPAITKFIIAVSEFLKVYGGVLTLVFFGLFALRILLSKKKWVIRYSHRIIFKLPLVGNFTKMVHLSHFSQAMTLLSAAKVPMVSSITLVKKMISFYPLQQGLQQVEASLLKGSALSESLRKNDIFDAKIIALVKVAEETNTTTYIFEKLHEHYRTEVQQRAKILTTIAEPLLIVCIGILVGIILIAMYLPMFKLSSVLG